MTMFPNLRLLPTLRPLPSPLSPPPSPPSPLLPLQPLLLRALLSLCLLATALPMAGPAQAADPGKTLNVFLLNNESALDPIMSNDANSSSVVENLFDPLLRYAYLARPVKLEPNTAAQMPSVSADGTTYTFQLKPGTHFAPDPAFKGQKRELTAQDYVYSFKRLLDPSLRSPWNFLLAGLLVGDEALTKGGKFSYDTEVTGLKATGRYTLQIRLKAPNGNFPYVLAMPATGVVAREVVEAYQGDAGNHPVGTGPFYVKEWRRSNQIILEANPNYREDVFHADPSQIQDPELRALAEGLNGKRLPLVGRVDVKVIPEQQTQLLGFLNEEFDIVQNGPLAISDMVVREGKLRPELAKRGIVLTLFPTLETDFMWMNMDDPVIGGYEKEKIALRRAIALSYDRELDFRMIQKQIALAAHSLPPPGVVGYDPKAPSLVGHNVALARALLDRFGYKDRDGDGYRENPQGRPLTLVMHSRANTTGRNFDEMWRKNLESIGVRLTIKSDQYPEIIKASRLGKVQMFEFGWVADFPDATNFYQLLHSKNIGVTNDSRFKLPEYDRLYEQSLTLPDSPERNLLFKKMDRLVAHYAPMVVRVHIVSLDLQHKWVKHYKRHPVENTTWRYVDVDTAQRKAGGK